MKIKHHPFNRSGSHGHQQGTVLAVSLIILLLMTLIAVSGMQTTTMEEKMSGNSRDRDLALQAAEIALRDAEDTILGLPGTTAFNDTNGLYDSTPSNDSSSDIDPPNYKLAATWSTSTSPIQSRAYTGTTIDGVAAQPRYFIQHLKDDTSGTTGTLKTGGYGSLKPGTTTSLFRITARGVGSSENAQVVLRTHYGMQF